MPGRPRSQKFVLTHKGERHVVFMKLLMFLFLAVVRLCFYLYHGLSLEACLPMCIVVAIVVVFCVVVSFYSGVLIIAGDEARCCLSSRFWFAMSENSLGLLHALCVGFILFSLGVS